MKKKIFLIAVLCLCMLGLAACSKTDPTTVDYNGYSYDDLKTNCQGTVQTLASMTDEDKQYYLENSTEIIANLITRWEDAVEEYGSFVDFGDFEITKSGKTLTAAQTLHMEDRDVILTYVYTYYSMELEDITIDGVYSVGEKMSTALMNTLMGMLVVFCVLIIISLIIYCFNIFPYLEKKKAAKSEPAKSDVVTQIEVREEQQTDDGELIAVIAAAIAAAEGTSTDGFVVRSIRRR
ncbi:OadG family protein [Roseburia sp. BX1005]|uniref:OadG family protein n=1 Tax=Roseburia zhanii TaxID=2763064 RepID=A0A923LPM8_9FIRM|nr:OadG family transporter subunit [Roseburia zhanii]MBC5713641.1 OadG family protein [Roseburia zhanii]